MAANPVLADSSYYIRALRERRDPLLELTAISEVRDVAVCGVVRTEVGLGFKTNSLLQRFQRAWDVMLYIPTDNRLWLEVETLAWTLARRGKYLPLADLVIACCALRVNAVVLTHDAHFHDVPGLTVTDRIY